MSGQCPWQFHGIDRADNGDGTVTLTLDGWRYTSNEERDPGITATCRWCRQPIHRITDTTWIGADGAAWCAESGPSRFHSPEPLPAVVHAPEPCVTRTVPARFFEWDGEKVQVVESGDAATMVAGHIGGPYTVIWQGRGWTVELQSGYPLWQTTS